LSLKADPKLLLLLLRGSEAAPKALCAPKTAKALGLGLLLLVQRGLVVRVPAVLAGAAPRLVVVAASLVLLALLLPLLPLPRRGLPKGTQTKSWGGS